MISDLKGKGSLARTCKPLFDAAEYFREHPRTNFFRCQLAGDAMLTVSGALSSYFNDGSVSGRLATGLMNTARSVGFFPLKDRLHGNRADAICSSIAVGTNIPLWLGAATPWEASAGMLGVAFWTARAVPAVVNELAAGEHVPAFIRRPAQSLTDIFARANPATLVAVPAAVLATRATMQIMDGISRQDPWTIAAGSFFAAGSIASYLSGRKHMCGGGYPKPVKV